MPHQKPLPDWYNFWLRLSRSEEVTEWFKYHSRINIRGRNYDIDTGSTPEDIWGGSTVGGGTYTFPTGATDMEIVSTDANDAAAGTGAQRVQVVGLDGQLNPIRAAAQTNGVTAVALSRPFYRINGMRVTHVGSGLFNAGQISVRGSGGGTVYGVIPTGAGLASHAIYTIKRGFTGYIVSSQFTIERAVATTGAEVSLFTRIGSSSTSPWLRRWNFSIATEGGNAGFPTVLPHPMASGTDLLFRCEFVTANNTQVATHVQMVLIENTRI